MSYRYLLDTNVVSDVVRHPLGPAAVRVRQNATSICTSVIVTAEMRFGVEKAGALRLAARIEAFLGFVPVLPFAPPADAVYARIRTELERLGTPIGSNDLLIAAHALATDCVLVTGNEREFSRVPGLPVENWLC
jgi:tRNA(fMet)-specific endonuclease VapC